MIRPLYKKMDVHRKTLRFEISPFYIKNACKVYEGIVNYKRPKDILKYINCSQKFTIASYTLHTLLMYFNVKGADLSYGIYTILFFTNCRALQLVNKNIVQNMVRGMQTCGTRCTARLHNMAGMPP